MWRYNELVNTLSGIYYNTSKIVSLLIKAQLNPGDYTLEGSNANDLWTMIIHKLEQQEKTSSIIALAYAENRNNPVLLDFRNEGSTTKKDVYSGEELIWEDTGESAPSLEKIIGEQSTLLPIYFLEAGSRVARAVARVITPNGLGTGFLISDDNWFITNNHVLCSADMAKNSTVQFNYQISMQGLAEQFEEFAIEGGFFHTSKTDDWTVVKLSGGPASKYGYIKLTETSINKKDFVNIIQHPGGEHKQIGLYHNLVTFVNENRIQYLTDTLPGSSGSPVFDSRWNVVALHNSGGWIKLPGTAKEVLQNGGINMNKILPALKSLGYPS